MIEKTIQKIEQAIGEMKAVDADQKKEVSLLLSRLKTEIEALSKTHQQHAKTIEFHLENLSPQALSSSVKGFEDSHPTLVMVMNELCNMLARIGI